MSDTESHDSQNSEDKKKNSKKSLTLDTILDQYGKEQENIKENMNDATQENKMFQREYNKNSPIFLGQFKGNKRFEKNFTAFIQILKQQFEVLFYLKEDYDKNCGNLKKLSISIPKVNESQVSMLASIQEECAKHQGKIYQHFIMEKFGFTIKHTSCFTQSTVNNYERAFDESLVYFIYLILCRHFPNKQHVTLENELGRLFKTTFFNSTQRNQITEKVRLENPHLSNKVKFDKVEKMIFEWESVHDLPKYQELVKNYNRRQDDSMADYRQERSLNIKKIINARSPLINRLCPSKENQKEKIEDQYSFSRSKEKDLIKNVRIGQILSAQNDTDHIYKLTQSVKLREAQLTKKFNKNIQDPKLQSQKTEIKNKLDNIQQEFYKDL